MPIKIFDEFLDSNIYEHVLDAADSVLKSGGNQFSTNRHWDYGILKDSAPVLVHNIIQSSVLHKRLKGQIEEKTKMKLHNNIIMLYFWTRYSYIPWHSDGDYEGGITIYLNKKWDPDNGGYFLYSENSENVSLTINQERKTEYTAINDIRAIIPKKNLAILQTKQMHHSTTPVNFFGDIRMTVQAFLDNG